MFNIARILLGDECAVPHRLESLARSCLHACITMALGRSAAILPVSESVEQDSIGRQRSGECHFSQARY